MASNGLGDYIHLHLKNYITYGINQRSGSNDFSVALQENRNTLSQQINKHLNRVNTKELSDVLTKMLYKDIYLDTKEENSIYVDPAYIEFIKAATVKLATHNQQYSSSSIISKSLTQSMSTLLPGAGKLSTRQNKTSITIKRLQSLLDLYEQSLKVAQNFTEEELTNIKKAQDIAKDYKANEKQLKATVKSLQAILQNGADKNGRYYFNQHTDNAQEIIAQAYAWIKKFTGEFDYNFSGPAFEAFLAGLNDNYNIVKAAGTNALLKNFGLTGNVTATTNITKSNWANYDYTSAYNGMLKDEKGNTIKSHSSSDNNKTKITTDVILSKDRVNNEISKILGNIEKLAISAKNYSNPKKHGVNLISSTTLYNILSVSNIDFANHYLNLIGSNDRRGYRIQSDVNAAFDEIKYIAAVRALTGTREHVFKNNINSNKMADCLVVNDRAQRRIHVFNISDLLNSNLDDIINFNGSGVTHSFAWAQAANAKEPINASDDSKHAMYLAAKRRITKYVNTTHAQKITLTLKGSNFNIKK